MSENNVSDLLVKNGIPTDRLEIFRQEIEERFGVQGMWASLFLIMQIDTKTWKFPDYVYDTPIKEMAEFIENNETVKSIFMKG